MSIGTYTSEQTAINDVVNTAQSNDDDDFRQWQSWVNIENIIVNPFVEDQHGSKIAEQGSQKRAAEQPPIMALEAQKIDSPAFAARKEQ